VSTISQLMHTDRDVPWSRQQGEAAIAAIHVTQLADAGVSPSEIAVITPYNAQAR